MVEPVKPVTPYGIDNIVADGCFLPRDAWKRVLRRFKEIQNLILQAPAGTGQIWLVNRLAMALIGQAAHEPQLRAVQFHSNFSDDDFVRGACPG